MSREVLKLNTDWFFLADDQPEAKEVSFSNEALERVNLPHTNKILPHHYFNEKDYQFVSWYRRPLYIDQAKQGKRLIVEFDGVMSGTEVYLNGERIGEHKGGYTGFSFDLTDYIKLGQQNILAVRVDSTRRTDIPPEGNVVDYLLFGGIYREVRLVVVEQLSINWSYYQIQQAQTAEGVILPQFELVNSYAETKEVRLEVSLLDQDHKQVGTSEQTLSLPPGSKTATLEEIKVKQPRLWDLVNPYLYTAIAKIYEQNSLLDQVETKIGIRSVEFKSDGKFYLNDHPLKLRGLNRHQMFPYLGNAMPARGQRKDAEILKYELGLNFVRSSHYPADPSFLDRCDEIGLLVFEEIPGWQHIGDQKWQDLAKLNLREMIIRDRNHCSIFLWGVRINESADDDQFYLETNRIARQLDQSRPTGGVRVFRESKFLEDVFTYNDFEYNLTGKVKLPNHRPYMITEYMGHMYPTKSYDSIERLINHALKHAMIQDKQHGIPDMAGASGWCAFDYNTHREFGSGDRVCYHGVCDMFRLPKFAGYFYKSQQSPAITPVVFIARQMVPSFFEDYGDEIVVFSNCEEVALYVGEQHLATVQPNYVDFPSLPHPPFLFKERQWREWNPKDITSMKAVGKIKGKKVVEHIIYPFGQPQRVELTADYQQLIADGSDCTRVVVELKDQNGQTLHLAHHPVSFELLGPARLIGENPFSLEAGRGAVFVQTGREHGRIVLKASVADLPTAEIRLESKPMQEKIVPLRKEE